MITAIVASTYPDKFGDRFALDCLKEQDGKEVEIYHDFDPDTKLGTGKLTLKGEFLLVDATFNIDPKLLKGLFVAPITIVKKKYRICEVSVITDGQMVALGTTPNPPNEWVTPIE